MFILQLQMSYKFDNRKVDTMKKFRVLVRGEHFKIDISGSQRYMGFFVTRFIEGKTPYLAGTSAIAKVRADAKLDGLILNDENDPPMLFVDEVEEISEFNIPDVNLGFVLFEDETQYRSIVVSEPPYLVIRKGLSFWVDNKPLSDWTATPQAFDEGCFHNASLYDTNGDLWQIVHTKLKQQPSFVNKLLPWRQLPVLMEIISSPKPAFLDVLTELAVILESGNSFSENLDAPPREILEYLKRATTPIELIQYAWECV